MVDLLAQLAPEDQALILAEPAIMAAARIDESATLGAAGPSYDLWLYTRPWDFDLGSIRVRVDVYSGDHDHNVPVQHAVDQAAAIPTSTLTVWPASGHFAGIQRFGEILARLTAF
jgi:pimeloyl-ACP methyl ester carboxylesterase